MDDPTPIVDAPSKPPRRFRRTRIAVSAFFGLLTVAVLILWARSYWWLDRFEQTNFGGRYLLLMSLAGHVTIGISSDPSIVTAGPHFTRHTTRSNKEIVAMLQSNNVKWAPQFPRHFSAKHDGFIGPHWALALAFAIIALAPWANRFGPPLSARFSLRTMLLATTLVAVVLGLVCYTVR